MNADTWVFGYGSLMWRTGFPYEEKVVATLFGWHRAMCILSSRYRGCPEAPGLVLGLTHGGCCRGIAFRVARDKVRDVRNYLWEREMANRVYRPRLAPLRLADGRRVDGWIFPAQPGHAQYFRCDCMKETARLIRQGVGVMGSSRDYLANTVTQLDSLGCADDHLAKLLALVDAPSEGDSSPEAVVPVLKRAAGG